MTTQSQQQQLVHSQSGVGLDPQGQKPPRQKWFSRAELAACATIIGVIIFIIALKVFDSPKYGVISGVVTFLVSGLLGFLAWRFPVPDTEPPSLFTNCRQNVRFTSMIKDNRADFFVSFCTDDEIWADWITEVLEKQGYQVIHPQLNENSFVDHISRADKEAKYIMIIWSQAYQKLLEQRIEDVQRFNERNRENGRCITVLMYEGGPQVYEGGPQGTLLNLIHADELTAYREILQSVPQKIRKTQQYDIKNLQSHFPGSRWNIPLLSSASFIARRDSLQTIREELNIRDEHGLIRPQALVGPIGIGKTEIALRYAYSRRKQYRYSWWIKITPVDSEEALRKEFESFAKYINDTIEKEEKIHLSDVALLKKDVKHWLEQRSDILLIIDKCDGLSQQTLAEFIPLRTKSHILLTTRKSTMEQLANSIEIEGLAPEDGAELLLQKASIKQPDSEDWSNAKKISDVLGGSPLALSQAGVYIGGTKDLALFLQHYQNERDELLQRFKGTLDYPEPLVTLWSLAYDEVLATNTAAAHLLLFCSFLAPTVIPFEICKKGSSDIGVPTDIELTDAKKALLDYSLVKCDEKGVTISVHRSLQAVILSTKLSNANDRHQWAERVIRAVNHAFPKVTVDNWQICEEYYPHVQSCEELMDKEKINSPDALQLLDRFGCYLRDVGSYDEAKHFLEKAQRLRKEAYHLHSTRENELYVAMSNNSVAELYHALGSYKDVEKLYNEARATREKNLGADAPEVAVVLNNLGRFYDETGDYDETGGYKKDKDKIRKLYKRALAIWKKAFKQDEQKFARELANTLNNLALTFYKEGHAKGIEGTSEEKVQNRTRALQLYAERDQCYAQSERRYIQALNIYRNTKTLGINNPGIAPIQVNLARIYIARGNFEYAEGFYLEALKSSSTNHPLIKASRLNNLGQLYREWGDTATSWFQRNLKKKRYEQASRYFEESLELYRAYKSKAGISHLAMATVLRNYAALLERKDKSFALRAISYQEQAKKIEKLYI